MVVRSSPRRIAALAAMGIGAGIGLCLSLASLPARASEGASEGASDTGSGAADTASRLASPLDYVIVDQRVQDLFAMVERDTGLRISVTDEVRGRVRRARLRGSAVEALARLAAAHDLDLFVYGGTIYVSAKAEATLRLVRLGEVATDRAVDALVSAGLMFAPDDLREAAGGSALTFTGPPQMLAIAEAIVESIPPEHAVMAATPSVRVRRGAEVVVETVTRAPEPEPEEDAPSDPAPNAAQDRREGGGR